MSRKQLKKNYFRHYFPVTTTLLGWLFCINSDAHSWDIALTGISEGRMAARFPRHPGDRGITTIRRKLFNFSTLSYWDIKKKNINKIKVWTLHGVITRPSVILTHKHNLLKWRSDCSNTARVQLICINPAHCFTILIQNVHVPVKDMILRRGR